MLRWLVFLKDLVSVLPCFSVVLKGSLWNPAPDPRRTLGCGLPAGVWRALGALGIRVNSRVMVRLAAWFCLVPGFLHCNRGWSYQPLIQVTTQPPHSCQLLAAPGPPGPLPWLHRPSFPCFCFFPDAEKLCCFRDAATSFCLALWDPTFGHQLNSDLTRADNSPWAWWFWLRPHLGKGQTTYSG